MAPKLPKLDDGFEEGKSDNLPRLTAEMMARYFAENPLHLDVETRHYKLEKSLSENYGDKAVELVQVRRIHGVTTVKAELTPETKTTKGNYKVTLVVNTRRVVSCVCHDCPASRGGCKHSAALVAWAHRRSEEPSPTEVICYWMRGALSAAGDTVGRTMQAQELVGNPKVQGQPEPADDLSFRTEMLEYSKLHRNIDCLLFSQFDNRNTDQLSMHILLTDFVKSEVRDQSAKNFILFLRQKLRSADLQDIFSRTTGQTTKPSAKYLWFELRYGRVTASKLHAVAQCQTADGAEVKKILGARKVKTTEAMERGIRLEGLIKSVVEKELHFVIEECGLQLSSEFAVFGASCDGVSKDHVFEFKAPMSPETFKTYFTKDRKQPALKFKMQIMLQMLLMNKSSGYFCVAHPDVETSQKVEILYVPLDRQVLEHCILKAQSFWELNIFPRMRQSILKVLPYM